MPRHPWLTLTLLTTVTLHAGSAFTPADEAWNQPVGPFTVAGNLHYVGAHDVSAFLITTPEGHILIDGGFRESLPLIESGVARLGFRLEDVRLLLVSHAHYDHIGCVAELKARTGARLLAPRAEWPALERGGAGDFAFGDRFLFPSVTPDGVIEDGEDVTLGGTTLTAHATPGHTRGSTTWSLDVSEGGRLLHVVIAASLTAPGYRLVGNEAYPEIVADFQSSFAALRALPCDILLSSHSWDFALHEKLAARAASREANPFIDPQELARFVDRAERRLREQLAAQSGAPAPDSARP